ncbi:MAG: alkyl hydroperoxide reductase [Bacteroidota bacterium]
MNENLNNAPRWMFYVLWIAGIYNILWGSSVIFFPNLFFNLVGMELPTYPMIWQCVGMIVGVYGVGYILAAYQPLVHYPIVLVGFLGKIFGPIGFSFYLAKGAFPLAFGLTIIFNDLIWWLPFGIILWAAYRARQVEFTAPESMNSVS